jgi:3-dehydrosphinganine reductase
MFDGKIIIITGGSSGVGKELARRLVKQGASLALIARDRDKLNSVKDELLKGCSSEQKIESFSCDVSDAAAVENTLKMIADGLGPPEILINSAGILRESYFEKQSLETFREIMDINYFGTLHCIKAVLPYLKKKGGGKIVNICSLGGLMGTFGYSAYCSSKFAMAGLTESLRVELKPQNIVFHLVCPPEFDSPMVDDINTCRTPENRHMVHTIPVLGVDAVADAIMSGLENNKYLIIPGRVSRMVEKLNRLLPGLGRMVVDGRLEKVYRGPDK